ncbi:hypothetical protein BKH41_08900 [Helicobacter sp. 12S02232-10]|uniref:hypothetical protein n=1 Tax=Helicobacter sp. 12S02232-10 TaxID=1476197 RepID=UPI000BA62780|nr:hypothetical protein [Helicobacter sp. 12S02232-10]PAF46613.1 hypothetical protein BKH41_08900 [Helicobacter sp. 12S02232-10]
MVEQDTNIEFKNFEDIGKVIVSLQDDLELIAAHIVKIKDQISKLESKANVKQPQNIKIQDQDLYYEYVNHLIEDDSKEREQRMKEDILQSLRELSAPKKKNIQKYFNIFLFAIVALLISIKGNINA